MRFLDYYAPQRRAFFDCAKTAGYDGIIRYLALNDDKRIDQREFTDALAAGMYVALVFETTGGSGQGAAYFTNTQGWTDMGIAIQQASALGYPIDKDYAIFLAVDVDVTANEAVEYFNGAYNMLKASGWPYFLGVYGGEKVIGANWPGVAYRWQTPAWSYGVIDPRDQVYQRIQTDVCGVSCDVNDISGEPTWAYHEEDSMTADDIWALIAPIVQTNVVAPLTDTDTAVKAALVSLSHQMQAIQDANAKNNADYATILSSRVVSVIGQILSNTAPKVPPSMPPGSVYFGESADFSELGFNDPTGKTHWFKDGVELPAQ